MTSGVVRTAFMGIPYMTRTDVRTVLELHEDHTGPCAPYRIWPEQGRQTEGRVRAILPQGRGGPRAPSSRPRAVSASASIIATSAITPTFVHHVPVRFGVGAGGMSTPMGVGVNAHWGFELDLPTFLILQRRAEVPIIQARARGEGLPWDIELDHDTAMSAEDEISDNTDEDIAAVRKVAAGIVGGLYNTLVTSTTVKAPVASDKIKGNCIRTLRKVADQTDAVLLVLNQAGRGADPPRENARHSLKDLRPVTPTIPSPRVGPDQRFLAVAISFAFFEMYETGGSRHLFFGCHQPPGRRQGNLIQHPQAPKCYDARGKRRGNTGTIRGLLCSYATWSNRKILTVTGPDDPTSDDALCTLPPISAPLQNFSTANRRDPRAHMS
ncbi:hypothetical protein EDB85DRAFT_1892977 [Lactarius pseudohatsudake]|nr:hypothetical protein EDB85DRAFT_1892977 [Lactarius pseudohatsudake]